MGDNYYKLPEQILIFTAPDTSAHAGEARRGTANRAAGDWVKLPAIRPVELTELQERINEFIQQMQRVLSKLPQQAGEFRLTDFEVSVGITSGGKGELKLGLIGGEVNTNTTGGLKFVFKRPAGAASPAAEKS